MKHVLLILATLLLVACMDPNGDTPAPIVPGPQQLKAADDTQYMIGRTTVFTAEFRQGYFPTWQVVGGTITYDPNKTAYLVTVTPNGTTCTVIFKYAEFPSTPPTPPSANG